MNFVYPFKDSQKIHDNLVRKSRLMAHNMKDGALH